MAIGRINIRVGHKGKATPHYSYITASGKYTKKQQELLHTKSGNMPDWVTHEKDFWGASDDYERANGTTYREHILSLPREFDLNQNIALIHDWIQQQIPHQPYTYAIHAPNARDGEAQPHCHLMFCDRLNDGIERSQEQFFKRYNTKDPSRGGAKKINTGMNHSERERQIKQIRQDWGDTLNAHLAKNGLEATIDMRNWQERGLDEPPQNISMIQIKTQERLEAHAQAHPYTAQRAKKEQIALEAHRIALEAHRIALEARQAQSEPQALEAPKQALEAEQERLARQEARRQAEKAKKQAKKQRRREAQQAEKEQQARLEAQQQAQALEAQEQAKQARIEAIADNARARYKDDIETWKKKRYQGFDLVTDRKITTHAHAIVALGNILIRVGKGEKTPSDYEAYQKAYSQADNTRDLRISSYYDKGGQQKIYLGIAYRYYTEALEYAKHKGIDVSIIKVDIYEKQEVMDYTEKELNEIKDQERKAELRKQLQQLNHKTPTPKPF
jgi:hypothetical protein